MDTKFLKRFKRGLLAAMLTVLLLHAGAGLLHAQLVTLQDGNSVVKIDPLSENIVSDWSIGDTNYLNRQGFWYLIGNSGQAQPLNTLAFVSSTAVDANGDGSPDIATLRYSAADGFQIDVRYSLVGGDDGSGSSSLTEQVKLSNSGANPMTVHLYQYTDADLSAGADTVQFASPSDVLQSSKFGVLESAVTGPLGGHEAGLTSDSPTTLQRLQSLDAPTLNGANGPFTGDATWAFQWGTTLQSGRSTTIGQSNSLSVAPEPGSLGLLAAAAIGLGLIAARRRSSR